MIMASRQGIGNMGNPVFFTAKVPSYQKNCQSIALEYQNGWYRLRVYELVVLAAKLCLQAISNFKCDYKYK